MKRIPFLIILILCLGPAWADKTFDLRGDQGVLMDLRPTGVEWLPGDRLFVVDQRYNAFHIFDKEGRRFRFVEFPRMLGPAFYAGTARMDDSTFFVTGSHYHEKNNQRYLRQRAVIHKIQLRGEDLVEGSAETDYSPDIGFRKTRLYGSTPAEQMEISGMGMDQKHNRVFFGLRRPLSDAGNILLLVGPLDEFLARDKDIEFDLVDTGLKPPVEPACSTTFYLSDLEYIPGRGVVLLLTADADGGHRFCSNQIWFMKGGFPPAKLVRQEIAPGNRATGMALRKIDAWNYSAALVCDHDPEETGTPSRLILLEEPLKLKLR